MKKIGIHTLWGIMFFCILFMSGCGTAKPEKLVKSELDLIKKLDEDTIRNFISYEDMIHSKSDQQDVGEETTEAIQLFFKNFKYKIESSNATADTATVIVEITNLDAKALAKDLCLALIKQSIAADSNTPHSANSYFALLRDILNANEYELVKTKAVFELVNKDDIWTIQNTAVLEDELVGGFISCLNDPYLVTPQEILTLAFEMFEKNTAENWISYLGMNDIFSTYSESSADVDFALAKQIAVSFSCQIKEVTVNGDHASAFVDITSLDMSAVLDEYYEKLMQYAYTTDAVQATDVELANKTAALLMETLNNNAATFTSSITLSLVNNGSTWEMQLGKEFTDALLGNMNAAIESFQSKASGAPT